MSVRSDAALNLSSLLHHNASAYEVTGEGQLMPSPELLAADGLTLAEPLDWRLTVQNTGGDDDFILTGRVAGTLIMECRRCLTEVSVTLASSLIYPMIYRAGREGLELVETEGEEEDTLLFGRPEVDFAPLLTQLFAIDAPLTALCKEDCRGLSPEGVNLNEHPELEPQPQDDEGKVSPFAVLKDLGLER